MLKIIAYLSLIGFSQIVLATDHKPSHTLDRVFNADTYIQVGETTFSILFWDIYKSRLQTTSGKYPLEGNNDKLVYQINYLADISCKDLIKRTVEQWQHLGIEEKKYQGYLAELRDIWPDIEDGDTLSLHVRNHKSIFYFNNDFIGEIVQQEFSQLFLDIWLSKHTSEPGLRLELLGVNNNE